MDLSVVFPAYNEEGNIENTVKEAADVVKNYDYEILVINDGSSDKTAEIVTKLSNANHRIKVIHHERNKGYAAATKTGLENAEGDVIFVIDSDGQHTSRDIPAMLDKMKEGYDIVVGWKVHRADPFPRQHLSKAYNLIFRLMFGLNLHDVDCGFRALKKEVAKKIKLKDGSYIVGTQMFSQAAKMNYRIAEMPIHHSPRNIGDTIFKPWKIPKMVTKIFLEMLIVKWNLRKMKQKEIYTRRKI